MNSLQFVYLWHDVDVVEVRVVADNGQFRGTADAYVGIGNLSEAAALLKGFPEHSQDSREFTFGAFGPKYAGGGARLELYCRDLAGHPTIRATIESNGDRLCDSDLRRKENPDSATVYLDFEPAGLDQFLEQLEHLERLRSGTASLRTLAT